MDRITKKFLRKRFALMCQLHNLNIADSNNGVGWNLSETSSGMFCITYIYPEHKERDFSDKSYSLKLMDAQLDMLIHGRWRNNLTIKQPEL